MPWTPLLLQQGDSTAHRRQTDCTYSELTQLGKSKPEGFCSQDCNFLFASNAQTFPREQDLRSWTILILGEYLHLEMTFATDFALEGFLGSVSAVRNLTFTHSQQRQVAV